LLLDYYYDDEDEYYAMIIGFISSYCLDFTGDGEKLYIVGWTKSCIIG
jgi:hypothetical protein